MLAVNLQQSLTGGAIHDLSMGMSSITNLSIQQLRRAADLKEKISALEKELNSLLGAKAPAAAKPARKKISAAGIARIKAAQKLRWAKIKSAKPAAKAKGKRGKMSASAKARLSAKLKAIWAARKAKKA